MELRQLPPSQSYGSKHTIIHQIYIITEERLSRANDYAPSHLPSTMKPAQVLATGLLFFLLFMPVFTIMGDLRVECELSEQTDCSEWEQVQGITGVGLFFGFILSVGGAYKMRIYATSGKKRKFCSKCGSVGAQDTGLCFVCDSIGAAEFLELEELTE